MASQPEKAKSQSPPPQAESNPEPAQTASPAPPTERTPEPAIEPVVDGTVVEVDYTDSAIGGSNSQSDWTSVTSSIYRGVFEHGRRYQALKEGEYWSPADDQQYESVANNHLAVLLYDQMEENQFFRSPINLEGSQILDIGCGEGQWALDVADTYTGITVTAVDLHPAPQNWTAPNCIYEVDDVTKPWTWTQKFDMIHLRWMMGSFTDEEWKDVYRKAYNQLKPGGWIEHLDVDVTLRCDDGSIDSAGELNKWVPRLEAAAAKMNRRVNLIPTMRRDIEEAGFYNVHEKTKKHPIGTWPKHPLMKEIGRVEMNAFKLGLEGYAMFLLTHFGDPEPWSPEEVHTVMAEMREDLDNRQYHPYRNFKRVWAQKPLDA